MSWPLSLSLEATADSILSLCSDPEPWLREQPHDRSAAASRNERWSRAAVPGDWLGRRILEPPALLSSSFLFILRPLSLPFSDDFPSLPSRSLRKRTTRSRASLLPDDRFGCCFFSLAIRFRKESSSSIIEMGRQSERWRRARGQTMLREMQNGKQNDERKTSSRDRPLSEKEQEKRRRTKEDQGASEKGSLDPIEGYRPTCADEDALL